MAKYEMLIAAIALAAPCGRRDSNVLDLADRRAEQAGHNAVLSILADPCPVHLAHPAVIGHAQFFDCLLRALLYIGKVVGNMSDTPYLMKEAGEEQKK